VKIAKKGMEFVTFLIWVSIAFSVGFALNAGSKFADHVWPDKPMEINLNEPKAQESE
jgi:hypothetical protein